MRLSFIFAARRYVIVVYAVTLCMHVGLSVRPLSDWPTHDSCIQLTQTVAVDYHRDFPVELKEL